MVLLAVSSNLLDIRIGVRIRQIGFFNVSGDI